MKTQWSGKREPWLSIDRQMGAPASRRRGAYQKQGTGRRDAGAPRFMVPMPAQNNTRLSAKTCRASRELAHAFTLIEIMVVVVILGVLAATIIPQLSGTTQDAKVKAAKAHVATLESALEQFYVHMDRYPTADEGLKVLVERPTGDQNKWRGPYIKMLRVDPWGNSYQYRVPGLHHTSSFDLWSRGADGADGGEGANADIGNWE